MLRFITLLCVTAILLAGCQAVEPPVLDTPSPTQAGTAVSTPLPAQVTQLPSLTPAPTRPPARNASYTMAASLNFSRRSVSVDERITYTNNSADALSELVLMVETNQQPDVFHLESLAINDGQPVQAYTLELNQLHLPLPAPLPAYQAVRLHLIYSLRLPEIPAPADDRRPVPFGYTEKQVNLVDWYPCIPPYQSGRGWLAHKPWFYGEHQVYDLADFQVVVNLVEPPAGLVLAASSPAQVNGSQFTYSHPGARNFVLSASPYYKVFTQQVGAVSVTSYAFTFDTAAGKGALKYTAEALDLYGRIFSPYFHPSLSVVEADFLDGMEYDGLYFLSRGFYNLYNGTPQGYLAAIAAHETAHQWWYARVANDQALEPWLDEALCTYTEYIFYKNIHPDYLKWWWQFRVDYYEPAGKVNLQLYDYTSYRGYRDAVYLNGAHFLDELRTRVGDDTFFAFLKDYAATFQGQIVSAADFFTLLNKHTTADYSDIKNKYFK